MTVAFTSEVWYWRGPAPWYFLRVPEDISRDIKAVESLVTYGWGMIPVNAHIGGSSWYTALWPKDGQYILPLRTDIRRAEGIGDGDTVFARLGVIMNGRKG